MSVVTTDIIDGKDYLAQFLGQYGLGDLSEWAWGRWQDGVSMDQIMVELRQQPAYKTRFPAMETLAQEGRAISEGEYIGYEKAAAGLMRQYGLTPGFYDQPDDFAALIGQGVSIAELSQRLNTYQSIAFNTDPNVRSELERLYGVTLGDLTALEIDPARALPLIQQQAQSVLFAAQAQTSGYGALTRDQAERYGGVAPGDAQQGFGTLVNLGEILTQLPGEAEAGVSNDSALAATFGGDATEQQKIARRQRNRVAEFGDGGGFSSSQQGLSGIGAA